MKYKFYYPKNNMKYKFYYPENNEVVMPTEFDTIKEASDYWQELRPTWDKLHYAEEIAFLNPITGTIVVIRESPPQSP